jgi:hypothetical protein
MILVESGHAWGIRPIKYLEAESSRVVASGEISLLRPQNRALRVEREWHV